MVGLETFCSIRPKDTGMGQGILLPDYYSSTILDGQEFPIGPDWDNISWVRGLGHDFLTLRVPFQPDVSTPRNPGIPESLGQPNLVTGDTCIPRSSKL